MIHLEEPGAAVDDKEREITLREVEARVEALDGIDLTHLLPGTRITVVTLAAGADANEAVSRLRLLDGATRRTLDGAASDWSLQRLRLPEVYSAYTVGDCRVAVCHIDSGANLSDATRDQYFYNPGEYAGALGIDDDGNGVVDDFFGANFIAGNNNSMTSDLSGHGTATARALTRTAPRVTLMPCKALTEAAVVPFSVAIQCIEWCKTNFENMRAHGGGQVTGIYAASWGGSVSSLALSEAMSAADALGATRALFVASAGNVPAETHFPASSGLANVLSVTHVDRRDRVTGNAGRWIDLAVPAESSSEAAAVAAGVAGLLVSVAPNLTPEELRSALARAAAPLPRTSGASFGRLDAAASFERLRGQGRLARPAGAPDRQPCVPSEVWAPAWPSLPAGSRPCVGGGGGRACWASFPAS
ncbi:hypothetical protein WJX81_000432 [Elliptochloris bilobata]|uniref:Peptidase S8/S53 domain-containing protein n=1 Tax=Elliptochloris bilobata TaxID=381761 RepID=A0AAW1RCT3_9CHLO